MTDFSVLIPAYNEAHALGRVLAELGRPPGCDEILVVDDGSTDGTAEVARQAGARVISLPTNQGYGKALKAGIAAVRTAYVVCCDGDGQHHTEDVLRVAREAEKYDMVVGVRGEDSHKDWLRLPGKAVLGWFANILTKRRIPDINSGLRSFRVAAIRRYLHLMPDGFSFSTTSSIAMLRMGYAVGYIPITVQPRIGRKSTVQILRDGLRVAMLILNLTVLFNPMRIFIPLSLLFMGGGLLYFLFYAMQYRLHVTPSMVMVFITGVLIFVLGIVCEQVSAIRRELHGGAERDASQAGER